MLISCEKERKLFFQSFKLVCPSHRPSCFFFARSSHDVESMTKNTMIVSTLVIYFTCVCFIVCCQHANILASCIYTGRAMRQYIHLVVCESTMDCVLQCSAMVKHKQREVSRDTVTELICVKSNIETCL